MGLWRHAKTPPNTNFSTDSDRRARAITTYDNTNRGALFTNEKRTKDSHPGFTGKINVEGRDYWLSAWGKTSKAGKKFLSLSVSPIEETNTGPTSFGDFSDDDVPF